MSKCPFSALSLSWNIRQLGVFSMTYPWFLEGWESTAEFWDFSNQNRQKQLRPKERDILPWKPTCPLKRGPFQKESRRLPTITFQGRAVSFRSWDGFSAMVISSNIFSWQVSTWTEEPYGLLSRNTHCNFAEFWFIPIHDNAYKASNTQEKMMQLLSCSSLFMQKKLSKTPHHHFFSWGKKTTSIQPAFSLGEVFPNDRLLGPKSNHFRQSVGQGDWAVRSSYLELLEQQPVSNP